MSAIYNEIEKYAAQWQRNLIAAGHIAPGEVDERSIEALVASDVRGATQFHTFSGIGVWSYALRLAGVPDECEIWTGSCPCQPWSDAGKGKGAEDERHLWPAWFRLIKEHRPPVIFFEQVASKAGLTWLDALRNDLEGEGYAVGVSDLPTAGAGAPHKRQRLFGCAYADGERFERVRLQLQERRRERSLSEARRRSEAELCADANGIPGGQGSALRQGSDHRVDAAQWSGPRSDCQSEHGSDTNHLRSRRSATGEARGPSGDAGGRGDTFQRCDTSSKRSGRHTGAVSGSEGEIFESDGDLADESFASGATVYGDDAVGARLEGHFGHVRDWRGPGWLDPRQARSVAEAGATRGFWADCDWYLCRDGKARPIEPGLFPLVNGAPQRVGRLRAYGNAISPWVAAEFIKTFIDFTQQP